MFTALRFREASYTPVSSAQWASTLLRYPVPIPFSSSGSREPGSSRIATSLFMGSTYAYTAIPQDQIRLVYLLPAASIDADLECEIHVYPRHPSPEAKAYEAVSYGWGTAGQQGPSQLAIRPRKGYDTFSDLQYFIVRKNLAAALRSV